MNHLKMSSINLSKMRLFCFKVAEYCRKLTLMSVVENYIDINVFRVKSDD